MTTLPPLPASLATPAYVLDVAALQRNLATARRIRDEAGDVFAGDPAALAQIAAAARDAGLAP